jgi:hypothetical protein
MIIYVGIKTLDLVLSDSQLSINGISQLRWSYKRMLSKTTIKAPGCKSSIGN